MQVCCIIKPDGHENEYEILYALKEAGARIVARKDIIYTDTLIEALYDHMDVLSRHAIAEDLRDKRGIAFLLEVQSIEHILDITGRESNPSVCAKGTIRNRFGLERPERRMGSWPWWDNVIHRPVNVREAVRDLALIFKA